MKSILFPFEISSPNHLRYAIAQLWARSMEAKMVYYTTIDPEENTEEKMDSIYLYLLQLHGAFNANYNGWKAPLQAEKVIVEMGDFTYQLQSFLQKNTFDRVIPVEPVPGSPRIVDIEYELSVEQYPNLNGL